MERGSESFLINFKIFTKRLISRKKIKIFIIKKKVFVHVLVDMAF